MQIFLLKDLLICCLFFELKTFSFNFNNDKQDLDILKSQMLSFGSDDLSYLHTYK